MQALGLACPGFAQMQLLSSLPSFISSPCVFVLENLDNLRKNGRLSLVQSLVTGSLRIKLLMGATPEGEICKKGQAMSVKQALNKMVALMADDLKHVGKRLSIVHCNCLERMTVHSFSLYFFAGACYNGCNPKI